MERLWLVSTWTLILPFDQRSLTTKTTSRCHGRILLTSKPRSDSKQRETSEVWTRIHCWWWAKTNCKMSRESCLDRMYGLVAIVCILYDIWCYSQWIWWLLMGGRFRNRFKQWSLKHVCWKITLFRFRECPFQQLVTVILGVEVYMWYIYIYDICIYIYI